MQGSVHCAIGSRTAAAVTLGARLRTAAEAAGWVWLGSRQDADLAFVELADRDGRGCLVTLKRLQALPAFVVVILVRGAADAIADVVGYPEAVALLARRNAAAGDGTWFLDDDGRPVQRRTVFVQADAPGGWADRLACLLDNMAQPQHGMPGGFVARSRVPDEAGRRLHALDLLAGECRSRGFILDRTEIEQDGRPVADHCMIGAPGGPRLSALVTAGGILLAARFEAPGVSATQLSVHADDMNQHQDLCRVSAQDGGLGCDVLIDDRCLGAGSLAAAINALVDCCSRLDRDIARLAGFRAPASSSAGWSR